MQKYVITGGPGVGKTTLLEALKYRGIPIGSEIARTVIKLEQRKEREIIGYQGTFPWNDLVRFQELVNPRQIAMEEKLSIRYKLVVLDRGLLDCLAYVEEAELELTMDINPLVRSADYKSIFVLDPLKNYVNDFVRKEDSVKAGRLHETLLGVYERYRFNVQTVPIFSNDPKESIDARVRMILDSIEKH